MAVGVAELEAAAEEEQLDPPRSAGALHLRGREIELAPPADPVRRAGAVTSTRWKHCARNRNGIAANQSTSRDRVITQRASSAAHATAATFAVVVRGRNT